MKLKKKNSIFKREENEIETGSTFFIYVRTIREKWVWNQQKLTLFFPILLFDPPENIMNPKVLCFQRTQKSTLGRKGFWTNYIQSETGMLRSKIIYYLFSSEIKATCQPSVTSLD